MSRRRVLLLEPNYKNKYPPMGLMKLAMYHRLQGYEVVFFKGDFSAFILSELTYEALAKFHEIEEARLVVGKSSWNKLVPEIKDAICTGVIHSNSELERVLELQPAAKLCLTDIRKKYRSGEYFRNPKWDRVCVTTLFTFHWSLTIETIEFAKKVCKDINQVFVGGILASVVPDKVIAETGIKPYVGCLNISRLPGDTPLSRSYGDTMIDKLPLDYSILEEIDYRYPASDAFYAYSTRGCKNKCPFCAVPILEPGPMKHYIPFKSQLSECQRRFGEQRHLLLLDNNVFASKEFNKIIDEIRDSGFAKGSTFVPPNQLDVAVRLLRNGWNDRAYTRLAVRLLNGFVEKLDGDAHDRFYGLLMNEGLLHDYTATKDGVIAVYEEIKVEYERARSKKSLVRFIDFNQGMDARLATPEKMAKLATVAIRPLRIAFDSWHDSKHYVRAVCLAKANGIEQMSNYLLYNFQDEPVDLYRRLLLNINLCMALNVNIYSFPMKYHPIMEEQWFSNRDYVGPRWTRKAIRTVQSVLNSTHGKIGRGRSFFFKAFGRNESEFLELIRMPEAFIIKRWDAEGNGLTDKWRKAYNSLSSSERDYVNSIVDTNNFSSAIRDDQSATVRKVLGFYMIERDSIRPIDETVKQRKIKAYEKSCPSEMSEDCKKLLQLCGADQA